MSGGTGRGPLVGGRGRDFVAGGWLVASAIVADLAVWGVRGDPAAALAVPLLAAAWVAGFSGRREAPAGRVRRAVAGPRLRRGIRVLAAVGAAGCAALAVRGHPGEGWTGSVATGVLLAVQVLVVAAATDPRDLRYSVPSTALLALQLAAVAPTVGVPVVVVTSSLVLIALAWNAQAGRTRGLVHLGRVVLAAGLVFAVTPGHLSAHPRPSSTRVVPTQHPSEGAQPVGGPQTAGESRGLGAHAATLVGGAATGVDLRVRGVLPAVPVLAVPADAPDHWRGMVYDAFDGRTWTVSDPTWRTWTPSPLPGPRRTDTVDPQVDTGGVIFTPGPVVGYSGADGLVGDGDGNLRSADGATGQYAVIWAAPASPAPSPQGRVSTADPAVEAKWTALPAGLSPRVRALAASLRRPSLAETVAAVNDYLRTHETYRLDAPVSANPDQVDAFLFETHVGFCEQFAAAEVVLLRASGIPARFVTGFAFGEVSGSRRIFRASDAHAWVQVWYPGVGWVDDDPTPPSNLVGSAPDSTAAPGLTGGPSASPTGAAPTSTPSASPAAHKALRRGWLLPDAGWRLPLVVALLGVVAAAAAVGRLRRPRRPGMHDSVPVGESRRPSRGGPVLAAYQQLLDSAGLADVRSPREALDALGIRADPEVEAALAVLEQECFGLEPPTEAEAAAAVAVFSRLRDLHYFIR